MLATARTDCLKLAVLLLLAPAWAAAQEGAPAIVEAAPEETMEEQLRELDEVVVRGERLAEAIIKAENDFYKLYNSVNQDDRYDVSCPYLNLSTNYGSRLNTRVCLPGFLADAIADTVQFQARCEPEFANFDSNRDGRISQMEAGVNADLLFQFDQLDLDGDGFLTEHGEFVTFERWAVNNLNCYRPPPPELVLLEGSDAWYRHMLKVTNDDPRLREMAGQLDALHQERALVQREFLRFEVQDEPREIPAALRDAGPRRR